MTEHKSWFEITHDGELVEARITYAAYPACPDTRECPGVPFSCEVIEAEVQDGDEWWLIALSKADRDRITLDLEENHGVSPGTPTVWEAI